MLRLLNWIMGSHVARNFLFLGIVAGVGTVLCSCAGDRPESGDMEILKARFIEPVLASADADIAAGLMNSLKADGSWPDIDYADSNRAQWLTARHMDNIRTMAAAWRAEGSSLQGDPQLLASIFVALDYWLAHDFINPNWWFNEIGVPRAVAPASLMLDDVLDGARRDGCLRILERAELGMTGQNLVWVSEVTIQRGLLLRDAGLVNEALSAITNEIRITPDEGIQPDYSFHQHGELLYSHGYGAGFITDCSRIATLVSGTRFAFPSGKITLLAALILDGHQWMTRGRYSDYGAEGREITRQNQNARHVSAAAENMLMVPSGREDELHALIARADGDYSVPLQGNRHFWRSDISTHQRRDYYTSARMYSSRTINTELINDEGTRSHHIADGCNFLFRRGDEYYNIPPIWDWQKIPGTTVVQTPELSGELKRYGATSFVGGVSDGTYGLAAFDFARDGLVARKSWFFFDDEYVCLGAGISDDSGYPVVTTLNQCYLHGDVTVSADGTQNSQRAPSKAYGALAWVHHDSTAYIFTHPQRVTVSRDTRHGSWHEINRSASDEPVSGEVFCAWINHDERPRAATYEYIVVPAIDSAGAARYAADPAVTVIANEPQLQVVRHDGLGLTGIVFYDAGACLVRDGLSVRVDTPCLLLIHERGNTCAISVSNPENVACDVAVEISAPLRGDGVMETAAGIRAVFSLPGGLAAGSSVTRVFTIAE